MSEGVARVVGATIANLICMPILIWAFNQVAKLMVQWGWIDTSWVCKIGGMS